jgi:hypothetical protein
MFTSYCCRDGTLECRAEGSLTDQSTTLTLLNGGRRQEGLGDSATDVEERQQD